jgi:hypothetical protein
MLEIQLAQLLAEVQALRREPGASPPGAPAVIDPELSSAPRAGLPAVGAPWTPDLKPDLAPSPFVNELGLPADPHALPAPLAAASDVETITITRATYKLPRDRAEALAAFITANVSDEVEVKVKENGLQVTATADDQVTIARLIRLLQTKAAPAKAKPPMDNPAELPESRKPFPSADDDGADLAPQSSPRHQTAAPLKKNRVPVGRRDVGVEQ